MNIFYLDENPVTCAQLHVDKHCVKMILEYAQLLSTTHRVLDGEKSTIIVNNRKKKVWKLTDKRDSTLYAATHINHPSAIWARASKENYKWLYSLFSALLDEYTYRYGKVHATSRLKSDLSLPPQNIPQTKFTQPTPAMPDKYKVEGNSIQSYQNYYNGDKQRMFAWKKRSMPAWIKQESNSNM